MTTSTEDACDHSSWSIWTQQHDDGSEWIHGSCEGTEDTRCPTAFKPKAIPKSSTLVPGRRDTPEMLTERSREILEPWLGKLEVFHSHEAARGHQPGEPRTNGDDPALGFSWRRFYSLFKSSWRRDPAREKLKTIGLMAPLLPLLVGLGAIIGWDVWENAQRITDDADSILRAATNVVGGLILMIYWGRVVLLADRTKTFREALREALPWTAETVSKMVIAAYLLFWLSTNLRVLLYSLGGMCVAWLWATIRLRRRRNLMLVAWIAAAVGWFSILYRPWPWDVWLGTQNLSDWIAQAVTLVTILAVWATVSYFRARRQLRSTG